MITENTKLYTEDGEYVGTVGQIRDGVAKMVGDLIDDILADREKEISDERNNI